MRTISIFLLFLGIQSSAQCYMDRHNTSWFDAWVSCETSIGPIENYGERHWIQYDLGYNYLLGEMDLWNINDPAHLNRGVSSVFVDYSLDGETWINMGTYSIPQADGTSIYEGHGLLDFDGEEARYLLITVDANHGAGFCAGFSEMRVEVLGLVSSVSESISPDACFEVGIFPNPHQENFQARIKTRCRGEMQILLHDAMGREVYSSRLSAKGQEHRINLSTDGLPSGIYYMTLQQGSGIGRYQLVKQ